MPGIDAMTRNLLYPALFAVLAASLAPQAAVAAEDVQNTGRGDTITLTKQEADEWKLRPVYTEDGEKIGKLKAVTLEKDGTIKDIRVSTTRAEGVDGSLTVPADRFAVEGQRIALDVEKGELDELASKPE